ncbi:MAG TPA: phage holin family protein [Burkholderiales bacterium]|nr:phage holin family protein [Burkholderiales bacterium]
MPPAGPAGDRAPRSPLRGLLRTLLEYAQTRTRIAASELEEQLLRFLEIALWSLAALFFLGLALVFASVLIVLAAWDSSRLLAAGLLTLVYLGAGAGAVLFARRRLAERPPLFGATLAELEKDRERFGGSPPREP